MNAQILLNLASAAEAASRFPGSRHHGVLHWRGVVDQGLWLAEQLAWPREQRLFLFAFGATHDCQRLNDDRDPEHGARAAAWLLSESWLDRLQLSPLADRLIAALIRHDAGYTSDDQLIGAAWDADRSLLHRVGINPSSRYFSTAKGTTFTTLVSRGSDIATSPDTWEALARRTLSESPHASS